MHIEEELEQWLAASIPGEKKNKRRDIKVVLNCYGFGDLAWPTDEEIGIELGVGGRERVRQVKNDSFLNSVKLDQLPIAKKTFELIESHACIPIPEVRSQLVREGLSSENTTIRGGLNLAHAFGRCSNFELYDSTLEPLSRSEAEFGGNTFLIQKDTRARLKEGLKKARTLPGRLGLAKFDYLRSELGSDADAESLVNIIRNTSDVCIVREQGDDWYVFEDRDNTLINNCEKIYTLTEQCSVAVLSRTLENAFRRRTHETYSYPTSAVLAQWFEQSKWFVVEDGAAKFNGKKKDLTGIEKDAVSYLQEVEISDRPSFMNHLLGLGHGKSSAAKAITASPLVTVDKSGQRETYQLISRAAKKEVNLNTPANPYQVCKNKLKQLLVSGTDSPSEGISRKEQSELRKFLFSNKETDACAICGEEFSVRALVAAHKKKRSCCTDSERVDPNIVFPLCLFGCDHLYELDMIRIVGNKVETANLPVHDGADKIRALALSGRVIDSRWLKGAEAYFSRNLA